MLKKKCEGWTVRQTKRQLYALTLGSIKTSVTDRRMDKVATICFPFRSIKIVGEVASSVDTDQMHRSVASSLGLVYSGLSFVILRGNISDKKKGVRI